MKPKPKPEQADEARALVIEGVQDVIVVGAGPAGISAAASFLVRQPDAKVAVLEAADRLGGRTTAGLHLIPVEFAANPLFKVGPALKAAKVRWDREWVDPADVPWGHKDWAAKLPQWDFYLQGEMAPLLELAPAPEALPVLLNAPVNKLMRLTDTAVDGWQLEAAGQGYLARQVVWAAGVMAFQNAVGKIEAQPNLKPNPLHVVSSDAADYRGGIALTLAFNAPPALDEKFPSDHVFALPFKHGGKLHLLIGAVVAQADAWTVQTLLHAHRDLFADPGEVASLQKSMRRALKALFAETEEASAASPVEKWVVSDRVRGHALGTPWMLSETLGTLEFVGDESLAEGVSARLDLSGIAAQQPAMGAEAPLDY